MPFPLTGRYPVSNKDLVSFTLDNPSYDVDRPVFIDPSAPSTSLSHSQTATLIRSLIAGLHANGFHPGDTVCIHSFNSIYFPVLCLAVIGAGGIFVGTNPSYTSSELLHATKIAKVKLVLSEPEIVDNMQTALAENGIDVGSKLFILDTRPGQVVPPGMRSWKALCQHGERDWIRFEDETRQRDTTACFFFTSGTTGLPKCAMTSHRNLVAEHQLFWEGNPRDYRIRAVHIFPLFHIGVFPTVLVSQLKDGREAYIMRRFELEPYLSYHERFGITEVFMAPPMVVQVVMSRLADPTFKERKYSLKSVRCGYVGAAPLSSDIQKRFHALLGDGARLTQIWGMTETTSQGTTVPNDIADLAAAGKLDTFGTVGLPLPEIQMKLTDEHGNDCTESGKGEACIKGPTVVRGYFENEKANKESWDADGYFKTGDVIQVDPKTGLFYVVERLKELIKVRGFQVAPAELEGVLTAHPDIVDAGVIGVPDEKSGELPRAYIVRREGSTLTAAEIRAYASERLARYKSLEGGIVLIDQIPKLPSGKILKRVLREWAKKGEENKSRAKL